MRKSDYLYHCIGTYERDNESCVGSSVSNDKCKWKKRCKAFTEHLEKKNKKVSSFFYLIEEVDETKALPKLGMSNFRKFCDVLIKNKKKKKNRKQRSDKLDGRKKIPTERTKKLRAETRRKTWKKKKEKLLIMLNEFKPVLIRRLGENRKFILPLVGKTTPVGCFYFSNRLSVSNYITIYCKSLEGWDVPLLSFYFKTVSMTFNIHFPCTIKEIEDNVSKHMLSNLDTFQSVNNGRFSSFVTGVDEEGLSVVADVVGKLIRRGSIKLPNCK